MPEIDHLRCTVSGPENHFLRFYTSKFNISIPLYQSQPWFWFPPAGNGFIPLSSSDFVKTLKSKGTGSGPDLPSVVHNNFCQKLFLIRNGFHTSIT